MTVQFDEIKVKDQLGRPDDKNITVKKYTVPVIIEHNTIHISKEIISVGEGSGFVLDSAVACRIGVDAWGIGDRSVVTVTVFSPDNVHREHFRDTFFKDEDHTTANWDTTNFRVSLE